MSESAHKRAQRVGELIRETLAAIFVDGLKDPRVGFVTVTEVRAATDLKSAKVFVSVFGTDAARQASIDGLNDAAGFLKRELGHRLKLRFTPELVFVLDTTLDQAQRLESLMQAIRHGETETPPAAAPDYDIPIDTGRSDLAEVAGKFEARAVGERGDKTSRRGPRSLRRRHGAR